MEFFDNEFLIFFINMSLVIFGICFFMVGIDKVFFK